MQPPNIDIYPDKSATLSYDFTSAARNLPVNRSSNLRIGSPQAGHLFRTLSNTLYSAFPFRLHRNS